jgi:hypothetical protein
MYNASTQMYWEHVVLHVLPNASYGGMDPYMDPSIWYTPHIPYMEYMDIPYEVIYHPRYACMHPEDVRDLCGTMYPPSGPLMHYPVR